VEGEPNLLGGLTDRGGHEIGLGRVLPPPRQRDVAGPGISGALGAADQEQRVRVGSENDGDGRPDEGFAPILSRRAMAGETIAQAEEIAGQWPWLWQPPPQHPPPGGGPRRLRSAGLPPVAGRAVSDIRRSSLRPWHWGQATLVSPRTSWSNSV
jgi:hypothetical protein